MKIKCSKCSREFEVPNGFGGRVICEDCDPAMQGINNRIHNGDCLDFLKTLKDKSVDAVITDPPFGIGFKYGKGITDVAKEAIDYWVWFEPIFKEMNRVLKDGGFMAIWQTQLYFPFFWKWFGDDIHIYAGCKNFVQLRKTPINYGYDPVILKYKNGASPLRPNKPKRNIDFFVANTAKFVTEKNSLARKHPCPRPIDQVEQIIENFVIEGGIILDCFAGSGTTGLAAQKLNRRYILVEKELEYIDIINKRLCL